MAASDQPHLPVLLGPLLRAVAPVGGVWVDGTFGAGGYARGLLAQGADQVIGIDRDPSVFGMAAAWAGEYGDRLRLVEGTFSDLDRLAGAQVDGVVLDLGVSSMQLDQSERGFSFLRDGPLDMRMGGDGPTAADLLNSAPESVIADVLYLYGEERASRSCGASRSQNTVHPGQGANCTWSCCVASVSSWCCTIGTNRSGMPPSAPFRVTGCSSRSVTPPPRIS